MFRLAFVGLLSLVATVSTASAQCYGDTGSWGAGYPCGYHRHMHTIAHPDFADLYHYKSNESEARMLKYGDTGTLEDNTELTVANLKPIWNWVQGSPAEVFSYGEKCNALKLGKLEYLGELSTADENILARYTPPYVQANRHQCPEGTLVTMTHRNFENARVHEKALGFGKIEPPKSVPDQIRAILDGHKSK